MNGLFTLVGFALFLGYAGLTVLYLTRIHSLFALLKKYESTVYSALGEPHLFWNNTPRTNAKVLPFLIKGRFDALTNENVKASAKSVRTLLIAGLVLFPLCVLLLFMGGMWRA